MPHLTLEYSKNLQVNNDFSALLLDLHQSIAKIGGIKIENFKSRVYLVENFLIANGEPNNGFVHLNVRFIEGRSTEIKHKIGGQARHLLLDWFKPLNTSIDLQVTVEIRDIQRSFYFKYPEGTLTPILK